MEETHKNTYQDMISGINRWAPDSIFEKPKTELEALSKKIEKPVKRVIVWQVLNFHNIGNHG